MCGITGIFEFKTHANEQSLVCVESMTACVTHRGPDAEGIHLQGSVCLGHRRLSIIDLDSRSNQPFTDASGRFTLIFNGQIYNFRNLKSQLADYPFRTTSDTEVIVAAYAQWKEKCLEKFNGMFVLAIHDTVEDTLFLARDRLGVKPLYFAKTENHFLFASEIRALLASDLVHAEIDETGLLQYLMYQASVCPNTILKGIGQVKPAYYMHVSKKGVQEQRYWTFGGSYTGVVSDKRAVLNTTREMFLRSVERRLISDVPLGAFLSGGIDSSAVVAAMAQTSDRVKTFSITFDEADYDESTFSGQIALRYKTEHYPIRLKPNDLLADLPSALEAMDSPSVDGINTYIISRATKQAGITVALSGLGGDELFAGYHYFNYWRKLKRYHFFAMPQALRYVVLNTLRRPANASQRERIRKLVQSDGSLAQTYPVLRQVSGRTAAYQLLNVRQNGQDELLTEQLRNLHTEQFPLLSQMSIAELTGYTLNVLLKDTDQFSMASALEIREPFFDYEFVDYVLHVPDRWKAGKTPKRLLVEALGDLLPDEVVHRKKRGFLLPWEHWLKNELAGFGSAQIAALAERPEFNADAVNQLWNAYLKGDKSITWPFVWQLIALSHWINRHVNVIKQSAV